MKTPVILLVEDNPSTRRLVRYALEKRGYVVAEAHDGNTALRMVDEMLDECRPSLVLQDLILPDMDGFALAAALRRKLGDTVLLLAFSGYVSDVDQSRIAEVGFDDVIAKPIPPSRLIPIIEGHLPLSGSSPESVGAGRRVPVADDEASRLQQRCSVLSAELSVLHAISEAMVRHTSIEQALEEAVASCFDASGISIGALYTLDDENAMRARPLGGTAVLAPGALDTFFGQEAMLRAIVAHGEVVTLPSPDWAAGNAVLDGCGATTALVVPLVHLGRPLGALLMVGRGRELASSDWGAFANGVSYPIAQSLALAAASQERQRAEEAALESKAEWQALADHVPDLVIKLDREGRILYVNRSILGLTASDAIGRDWVELAAPEHRAHMRQHLEQVLAQGVPVTYELMSLGQDAGASGAPETEPAIKPVSVWYSSHLGSVVRHGKTVGAVALWRDITQRKQTEAQLIVSDRMVSIGTLAAGVAHEINNPLAAVIANLDLAQRQAADLAKRHGADDLLEIVTDAQVAAERVRQIVRDLKLFSRSSDDESHGPVDLHAALESTLRMASNEIRHRASLVKELGDIPPVDANEARLGQVFLNLLVNAAQAIPEGHAESNQIRLVTRRDGPDRVVVEVTDTGVGMSAEVQRRLFTPFFTTKPVGIGTGLGLPICQRIVSSLGGTIEVTSELGKGSTFVVRLPVAAPPVGTPRVAPTRPPLGTPRGRVLVIDDERMVATVVRRILAVAHDVTPLEHAEEALALIRAGEHFDVVLCDLMMPQMTGMDFYAELLRSFPHVAERVIFLTGGPFTSRAREFLDGVPNMRIDKPFDAQELRRIVASCMV